MIDKYTLLLLLLLLPVACSSRGGALVYWFLVELVINKFPFWCTTNDGILLWLTIAPAGKCKNIHVFWIVKNVYPPSALFKKSEHANERDRIACTFNIGNMSYGHAEFY